MFELSISSIFRSNLIPALSLVLLSGICGAPLFAASESPTQADGDKVNLETPHYELVMSEDDGLCNPLVRFYNVHSSEDESESLYYKSGFIEDRFAQDLQSPGPTFASIDTLKKGTNLDIFNTGDIRNVIIQDHGLNYKYTTLRSILYISKAGEREPQNLGYINKRTSDWIDYWIDFSESGPSTSLSKKPYVLRHLPGSKTTALKPTRMIGQGVVQRIMQYNGKIFVMARTRILGKIIDNDGNMSLLYKILPDGTLADVCYFRFRSGK